MFTAQCYCSYTNPRTTASTHLSFIDMKLVALLTTPTLAGLTRASSDLRVMTPAYLATCEHTLLVWEGGEVPYFPAVLPGGRVEAAPVS
ncbi:hypothetical protein CALVIDRAFT_594560 [Calocera viscosa TUFC12733]|uniref:Uncharacterized protein n=1 Tax=Calocera viscosa (strain TUFC12733) TaxID=1330018 RepID=A0A167SG60_CALVF|nr:hypothetical protein CALVIDRAFT_594560 [Calocera viscosa TUFC12733]